MLLMDSRTSSSIILWVMTHALVILTLASLQCFSVWPFVPVTMVVTKDLFLEKDCGNLRSILSWIESQLGQRRQWCCACDRNCGIDTISHVKVKTFLRIPSPFLFSTHLLHSLNMSLLPYSGNNFLLSSKLYILYFSKNSSYF